MKVKRNRKEGPFHAMKAYRGKQLKKLKTLVFYRKERFNTDQAGVNVTHQRMKFL
jgi:hypothetical protein